MSAWMPHSPGVTKEIRALLPTWLASIAAIFAATVVQEAGYSRFPSFAFLLGLLALGAQSVGHEYTHRTLPVFLTLPTDRGRLLLNKLTVLIVMLLTVSALAWLMLFRDPAFVKHVDSRVLVVGMAAAFFLAPWLTVICRNSHAGIVFSIAVPAVLLIAGDLIGVARYGIGGGALIDDFKFAFLWRGLFIVCTVAAVSTWRMFERHNERITRIETRNECEHQSASPDTQRQHERSGIGQPESPSLLSHEDGDRRPDRQRIGPREGEAVRTFWIVPE
jgi:hypothetical protein